MRKFDRGVPGKRMNPVVQRVGSKNHNPSTHYVIGTFPLGLFARTVRYNLA